MYRGEDMHKIVILKPRKGLKVPRPLSQSYLPEKGAELPLTSYWVRRIQDGDVEVIKKASSSEEKPKTKRPKAKTKKTEGEL